MEEAGDTMEKEGAAEVRHHHLRKRPEGFERHHVLQWLNCTDFTFSTDEATFNLGLKFMFLLVLTLSLTSLVLLPMWVYAYFLIGSTRTVLLLAVVAVVAVLMMNQAKMSWRPAPTKREPGQTCSGLVQLV